MQHVIHLEDILPRLFKLLRNHKPPVEVAKPSATHGALALAASAAVCGGPLGVDAVAAMEEKALHEALAAQLDPHLPVTHIIR